jgi:hypothetical protein
VPVPTAERALDVARYELQHAGNPAYTAVAVLPGGAFELGAMIVTSAQAAARGAELLGREHPAAAIHVVGCHQGGGRLRYVVLDATGAERQLVREEVREAAVGGTDLV